MLGFSSNRYAGAVIVTRPTEGSNNYILSFNDTTLREEDESEVWLRFTVILIKKKVGCTNYNLESQTLTPTKYSLKLGNSPAHEGVTFAKVFGLLRIPQASGTIEFDEEKFRVISRKGSGVDFYFISLNTLCIAKP